MKINKLLLLIGSFLIGTMLSAQTVSDFETVSPANTSANWGLITDATAVSIVNNPLIDAVDGTAKCLKTLQKNSFVPWGSQNYFCAVLAIPSIAVNKAGTNHYLHVRYLSYKLGQVIKFSLVYGSASSMDYSVTVSTKGEWVEAVIDLSTSSTTITSFSEFAIYPNTNYTANGNTADQTTYFDNIVINSVAASGTSATFNPTPNTTTVLKNPLMNLVQYLTSDYNGNWSDPTWYLNDVNTSANCNTIYLRAAWMCFEPTEGNYVWNNNQSFKNLVAAVKAKGWRLGFRVMCQDDGLSETAVHGTPQYVIDAMRAAGYTNPYAIYNTRYPDVTNPVWQAKFKKFILAFGAKFNDPTITDYVDANGLGKWGEGNLVGIAPWNGDHTAEKAYYDWHLGVYAQAFTKVILNVTPSTFGTWDNDGYDQQQTDLTYAIGKYGCIWRKDGIGEDPTLPYVTRSAAQLYEFTQSWPSCPMLCEPWNPGFASNDRSYMSRIIQDVQVFHGNNLTNNWNGAWLTTANTDLLAQLIATLGYRLRPTKVIVSTQGATSTINHTWTNDGSGVLPNANVRWGKKYQISYALISGSTVSQVFSDVNADPGVLVKGTNTSFTTTIPWTVAAGTYQLAVGVTDKTIASLPSLDLALTGTRLNGWYVLGNIIISNVSKLLRAVMSNNNQQLFEVKLFPNPVNNQLTINGMEGKFDLQITNMNGIVYKAVKSVNGDQIVDVSRIPAGLYNASLISENGRHVNKKFIIIK